MSQPGKARLTDQGRRTVMAALHRFEAGESVESIALDLTDGRVDALQFLMALAKEVGAIE